MAHESVFNHLGELGLNHNIENKVAYVCGAGPGLRDGLASIPRDSYAVACNSAIAADYPFALWMAFDANCPRFAWFHYGLQTPAIRVFGGPIKRYAHYAFSSLPCPNKQIRLADNALNGRGTIVCCALQLMLYATAKKVILIGCPFGGSRHDDGSTVGKSARFKIKAKIANRYIRLLKARGMDIVSMGPTALDIEVIA